MSEIKLQANVVRWAWNNHPQTRKLLFHVPNGGSRNKAEAMQLKSSGVIAGVPDLLFVWAGKLHAFECKTLTGTVSPEQKELHALWKSQGIDVHIFRNEEEFQKLFTNIITDHGKQQSR